MTGSAEWQRAFALQARADLASWQLLIDASAILCHQYQFMQMACEKLCKAFLCEQGANPGDLQASHAYIGKTLPVIGKRLLPTFAGTKSQKSLAFHLRALKQLAREIELLALAVDDGGRRPENCEYPWEDGQGKLHVPAEFDFPSMKLLATPIGRLLPRLLNRAIDSMLS